MDGNEISRRKLLGGIAIAGSAGAVSGAGSAAMFSDRERTESEMAAGILDLRVEWEGGGSSDGTAPLAIDLSGDETSGEELFTVSLPGARSNNPAYVWLGATCPASSALTASLVVTLSYADCDGETSGEPIVSGSLLSVADELASGVPIDADRDPDADAGSQSCLHPGTDLCFLLEWELDEEYTGTESTSFEFRFVGRQCRGAEGTTNPFPAAECDDPPDDRHGVSNVEIWICDEEDPVGKLELDDEYCEQEGIAGNSIEPGRSYDLYEDDDCEDSGYDVSVTETETNDDGEVIGLAFELLEDDGDDGPDLCRVDIKGGAEVETYGEADLEANATDGVLYAPKRTRGGNDD